MPPTPRPTLPDLDPGCPIVIAGCPGIDKARAAQAGQFWAPALQTHEAQLQGRGRDLRVGNGARLHAQRHAADCREKEGSQAGLCQGPGAEITKGQ